MILTDETLLDEYRGKDCWFCLHEPRASFPHHVRSRGFGGGTRLDHRFNLAATGPKCHERIHSGHIRREVVLAVVADRNGVSLEALIEVLDHLLRVRA